MEWLFATRTFRCTRERPPALWTSASAGPVDHPRVSPAGAFWEAEPEHQDYMQRIPDGYACNFIRPDWKLPSRMELG